MESLLLEVFDRAVTFCVAFNQYDSLSYLHPTKTRQKYNDLCKAIQDVHGYMCDLVEKGDCYE